MDDSSLTTIWNWVNELRAMTGQEHSPAFRRKLNETIVALADAGHSMALLLDMQSANADKPQFDNEG